MASLVSQYVDNVDWYDWVCRNFHQHHVTITEPGPCDFRLFKVENDSIPYHYITYRKCIDSDIRRIKYREVESIEILDWLERQKATKKAERPETSKTP